MCSSDLLACKVTDVPTAIVTVSCGIVGMVGEFTVIVTLAKALSQLAVSHLTLNVLEAGKSGILVVGKGVISSFSYHFTNEPSEQVADKITPFPLQIVVLTVTFVGFAGFGFTVIVKVAELAHCPASGVKV